MAVNDPRKSGAQGRGCQNERRYDSRSDRYFSGGYRPSAFTRMPTVAFNVLYVVKTVYGTCRKTTEYEERVHGRQPQAAVGQLAALKKSGRENEYAF